MTAVIPPWKQGSTVVEDVEVRTQTDHMKEVARLGGLATQRNKRLRAQGFQVKSAQQIREEKKLQPKKPGVRGNPNPDSGTSAKIARMTDENLSDKMRDRAIRFCKEYIRDFNVMNAWLRIGGNPNTPTSAREMFRWPFVQQYLAQLGEDLQVQDVITPTQVALMMKREANYFGEGSSHSARVAAVGKLGRFLQMEVQVKKEEITHKGGVMVVPAAPQSMDDWEANVSTAQRQLKADVVK